MRVSVAVFHCLLTPGLGLAQGAPGTNITVDVRVTALSMRADTAVASYVLQNHVSSAEQLFRFTVDAPSAVVQLPRPQPTAAWRVRTTYRGRSVAAWVVLEDQMGPGEHSPPLTFEALGLPTIVTYWVGGYFEPPALTAADTFPVDTPSDPLVENSLSDSTVGIEPFPTDLSPGNLLLRLRALLDQSCATSLAWITSATVCSSLGGKVDGARAAILQGDTATGQTELTSFLTEVESQHGAELPVNDSAYWLLKVNSEYILGRL